MNFNGRKYLESCLRSVLGQSHQDFEIVLVDNASSDDSVSLVRSLFTDPRIKIVVSDSNLGFSGGNNLGFKHCTGEYIVLLNNDTVVEEDWLKILVYTLESDINIGIVQSLVLTEGIPGRFYRMNGTVNLLGHNIMEIFPIGEDGVGEILVANGCSLIIRSKLVNEFGGLFPEFYFAYSEDTFLSFRVKFMNKRIVHNSNSVVRHKGGGASAGNDSLYFYKERNRLLNFLIFFDTAFVLKYVPYLLLNFLMKFGASFLSRRYNLSGLVKAYMWIITNPGKIMNERKKVRSLRNARDEEVLRLITSKLTNGKSASGRFLNMLSLLYCKCTFMRTMENKKE